MGSSWVRVGPKSNDWCLYKRGKSGQAREHHAGRPREDRGRGWSDASICQKMPRIGTSLVVQWLRLHASTAGGAGLSPGQGTKVPQASGAAKKKTIAGSHLKRGERQERFLPQTLQKEPTLLAPGFLASGLLNGERIHFYCFWPSKFMVICYGSRRKLICHLRQLVTRVTGINHFLTIGSCQVGRVPLPPQPRPGFSLGRWPGPRFPGPQFLPAGSGASPAQKLILGGALRWVTLDVSPSQPPSFVPSSLLPVFNRMSLSYRGCPWPPYFQWQSCSTPQPSSFPPRLFFSLALLPAN